MTYREIQSYYESRSYDTIARVVRRQSHAHVPDVVMEELLAVPKASADVEESLRLVLEEGRRLWGRPVEEQRARLNAGVARALSAEGLLGERPPPDPLDEDGGTTGG